MNRKEFFKVSAAASLASLLSPLSAYAEKFESEGKKVKVAVIGCGSVSTQYFPHISKCPYVEIVACCDIKPDRAQKAAKQYNIPKWYKYIDDMLSGSKFDLMLTLTDMQVHGELNRKALMAGRNVWSEKPLANSYKEGKELYDLATSKGLRIWGAPAVVNSPQFAFMAEQINKGTLGNLACAHGHYGHEGPSWSAFFYEPLGGSMPDLGVYNIATLTGLLGPAKSVVAMTTIVTPERTVDDKGKIKVREEDNAMIIMEHEKGVLSHIECGFNYFDPYGHLGKGQSDDLLIRFTRQYAYGRLRLGTERGGLIDDGSSGTPAFRSGHQWLCLARRCFRYQQTHGIKHGTTYKCRACVTRIRDYRGRPKITSYRSTHPTCIEVSLADGKIN